DRVLLPPARIKDTTPAPAPMATVRAGPAGMELELARTRRAQRSQGPAERLEQLLFHLPIGIAVINRRYDVQSINAMARRLLGIHLSAIGDDFVHLAHQVPSAALRGAIDAAFRGESSTGLYEVSLVETVP